LKARQSSKLINKIYQGRALLVCTGSCAMNADFVSVKNYNYETQDKTFTKEIELIQQDTTLTEIILSGGDPLSLSNDTLTHLIQQFGQGSSFGEAKIPYAISDWHP
jgi:L-lysine 2,3-aminomutase